MQVEHVLGADLFMVYDAPMPKGLGVLDPVLVILRDQGSRGHLVVECYGAAWSCWFGAIGNQSFREFLAHLSAEYLASKMISNTVRKTSRREEKYVEHICSAVILAMKGGAA